MHKLTVLVLVSAVLVAAGLIAVLARGAGAQAGHEAVRPATVVLITSKQLASSWRAFADWKTRLGKATEIVTVDQIGKRYQGDDIQAKIRACVLEHVEKRGTRWVVLGGDSRPNAKGHVPHRVVTQRMFGRRPRTFPGSNIEMGGGNLPVDLYYISPADKDWDADDDGKYGEWKDDRDAIAYTHPSGACLGRIPVRTKADVIAYTEKVIAHESRYPTKEFAERFLYTNTTRGSEPKVRKSWDAYISKAWPEGKVLRFFHTSTPWDKNDKGDYALNRKNFRDRINAGTASKMHMHGHGMPQLWVLEHKSGRSMVNAKVIGQMKNKDAYLMLTTVSCFTGQYDTEGDPCITETMLRAPNKGAILIVAPSRPGVPVFHNPRRDFQLMMREGKLDGTTETMTRFWVNGLTRQEDGGYLTAGEAFARTKAHMAQHAEKTAAYHAIQCEINLLGDPTLDLRAVNPSTPSCDAPAQINVGSQELVVTTTPGATVCAWKGNEVYAVAKADAKGRVALEIAPAKPGKMLLTVSGPNLNAALKTIEVAADASGG